MGKTRDLFKKIRDTKGPFHAKMGTIKDNLMPCGDSRESHSPPALLDRGPHILLTHQEVR